MPSPVSEFQHIVIGNTLRKCDLFSDLPTETLRGIAAISVVKSLGKGDYLFHEGIAVHGFYVVQQGAIKLHRVNASGKEQVIHVFRQFEVLGEEALLSEVGYPADACATEPSRVVLVRRAEFLALLRRQPELVVGLLRSLGHQFRLLLDLLEDLTLKDVQTRLANWLIQRCPNPESDTPYTIELPMAKRLLASELGTVSETFSRALAKFKKKKLLTIDGKCVTLLSPSRLVRLMRTNLGLEGLRSLEHAWNGNGCHAPESDLFAGFANGGHVSSHAGNGTVHPRYQEAVH
ncbi:MAG: Crp/Fnr family transcriptional regulator [Verrucomicrobia bacterium]|nr:Crp/Fnr family transcriptional regulator [Verrucomicrobiota bacterium]